MRHLHYFVKYEHQDRVQIGVIDAGRHFVEEGSDAALTEAAGGVWDEDTICAAHALERLPAPAPMFDAAGDRIAAFPSTENAR